MITYKELPDCPCPIDDATTLNYLFDSNEAQHFSLPLDRLSSNFVQWINEHNMVASFLEIFYLPVDCTVRRIHTDLDSITDKASKINYIIGGEDALMQWFDLKDNAKSHYDINRAPDSVQKGKVSPYLSWPREECIVIDEVTLKGSNLVHAGIPHVVFTKTKPRIAVSVVLQCKATRKRLSCEEVLLRL
jgi:hypothetical protein